MLETAKGAACDPMSMTLPGIEKKNEPRLILTTILIIINRIFYRVPFSQFFKGLYNIKQKKCKYLTLDAKGDITPVSLFNGCSCIVSSPKWEKASPAAVKISAT